MGYNILKICKYLKENVKRNETLQTNLHLIIIRTREKLFRTMALVVKKVLYLLWPCHKNINFPIVHILSIKDCAYAYQKNTIQRCYVAQTKAKCAHLTTRAVAKFLGIILYDAARTHGERRDRAETFAKKCY